jgi:hypothetical protein
MKFSLKFSQLLELARTSLAVLSRGQDTSANRLRSGSPGVKEIGELFYSPNGIDIAM